MERAALGSPFCVSAAHHPCWFSTTGAQAPSVNIFDKRQATATRTHESWLPFQKMNAIGATINCFAIIN